MTKAEEKASVYIGFPQRLDEDISITKARYGFIDGYKQAEKEFMNKAKLYFERRSFGELNAGKEYAIFKRFMSK